MLLRIVELALIHQGPSIIPDDLKDSFIRLLAHQVNGSKEWQNKSRAELEAKFGVFRGTLEIDSDLEFGVKGEADAPEDLDQPIPRTIPALI